MARSKFPNNPKDQVDSRTDFIEKIAEIDRRILELDAERNRLLAEKERLSELESTVGQLNTNKSENFTSNQKVEIFKNLFTGRIDVYATRWENAKGRSGYSVACHNEWKQNICHKPKVKCGECLNKLFKSFDEQAIFEHLTGKQTIGLYPLMTDNTCRFLVADFDKKGWQESVRAMAKACDEYRIPRAIEVSRSGNGAHLWIFFEEPVSARDARQLGFAMLDRAMELHADLSFESYDRLFPNQDIMPEGGFGNLIALPLQLQVRNRGNTEFVDDNLRPYDHQWVFLAGIRKFPTNALQEILAKKLEVNLPTSEHDLPWEQGLPVQHTKIDECPKELELILANQIYMLVHQIPSALLARLKRIASFSNPVFFKTQALRFSTHGIPRFISCARVEQGYLALPRGCLDDVVKLLSEQDIQIRFDDKRNIGSAFSRLEFNGKLRRDQKRAVNVLTQFDTGVLHAPTAFGKTVVAINVIATRKVNTLILTHSREILEQWYERLQTFLPNTEIGIIRGGKRKPTGLIDIATYQSLINKKDNTVLPEVLEYGQIIIDECHHISAPRFEMLLNEVRAKYVLGLTATPERQDGHQKIIFMLAGPVRQKINAEHSLKFEQNVVVTQIYDKPPATFLEGDSRPQISDVYQWLADNENRNKKIVSDVETEIKLGKQPLILTERRAHAELIDQLLTEKGIRSVLLKGAMGVKDKRDAKMQLNEAQSIVATGKYVGEGFDLPRLDTLFLAMPISWKGSLAQYAGRIHRESEGKEKVTIFDYVDTSLPMLQRMFQKREKGYKAMGYCISYSELTNYSPAGAEN